MAYLPNIPAATDTKAQSQPQIQANFQAINTAFSINHVTFDLADQGKHKWVTCPVQAATPPVGAFAAGENGFYNYLNATTAQNEMYVHHQWNAGAVETAFTASKMSNNTAANSVNGWTYLPSGLLIKWGNATAAEGSVTVNITPTVTAGGPNFTRVFRTFLSGVQVGGVAPTEFICGQNTVPDNTSGNFQAYYSNPSNAKSTSIDWMLIGV